MVRSIKLSNGVSIPALGYGAMVGHTGRAAELCAAALESGILHLDTAQIYNTEVETGEAIKLAGVKRDEVFVTSKLFYRYSKANTPQTAEIQLETNPEAIRASVQSTLDKLGFQPDLLLIHNPYIPAKGKILEFWKILEDLVEDGTLGRTALGVSNFRPQDIQEILDGCKIRPVVNQIEYHPYVLAHLTPLLDLQKKEHIVTQSYGTLSPLLRHPTGGPLKPILSKLAQRLSKESGKDVDEAGVLLLWTIGHGVVALTSSTKPENLKKMVETEELRDLTQEEMDEIDETGKSVHFRAYDEHMTKDFDAPNLPEDR